MNVPAEDNFRMERRIVIGMIVSSEYLVAVRRIWRPEYLSSEMASLIGTWCLTYYEKYGRAPGRSIEGILLEQVRSGLPEPMAQDMETSVLPSLSEEYDNQHFNLQYLVDRTIDYFRSRRLLLHTEEVRQLVSQGRQEEAEELTARFESLAYGTEREAVDMGSEVSLERLRQSFSSDLQSVISFPGALGDLMNRQLTRGAFVAFMAPEKRGKSFWLLEMAMRGVAERCNVVFFEAGDNSENQVYRRIAVYLAQRPEEYGEIQVPVKDCYENQSGRCSKPERESRIDLGMLDPEDATWACLSEKRKDIFYADYRACRNCEWGSKYKSWVWHVTLDVPPLDAETASRDVEDFFLGFGNKLKVSRHDNGELSLAKMTDLLRVWERQEGFVPDMIVVDYADLIVADNSREEHRHRVDDVWKGLRGLSQKKHCLLVTATQADAKSFTKNRLSLANFSEDKRKYSHVTAMYALNQDPEGEEKKMGIMRVSPLVVRNASFSASDEVYVLCCHALARPFLDSFRKYI